MTDRGRPPDRGSHQFRHDIEGLRGVAVLLVVLYHVGFAHFYGGFVGVDVFFVISGFVITSRLLERRGEPRPLLSFYAGRVRRLLPLSTLVVAVVLGVLVVRLGVAVFRYGDQVRAAALYAWNLWASHRRVIYGAEVGSSPFEHFWSLATEEQFYLLWPAIVLLVAGRRATARVRRLVVVTAGLAAASLIATLVLARSNPLAAFYLLPTRLWEILAGALVALAGPRLARLSAAVVAVCGWIGLGAVIVSANRLLAGPLVISWRSTIPVLGAALLVGATGPTARWGPARLLGLRPLVALGSISYALYLCHWPVVFFFLRDRDPSTAVRLVAIGMSLALAVVAHLLVERPMRWRIRPNASPSRVLAVAVVVTALTVIGASLVTSPHSLDAGKPSRPGVETRDVPSDLDPALDRAAPFDDIFPRDCPHLEFHVPPQDQLQGECVRGDPNAQFTIALMGDSHAAHWIPAFEEVARRHGFRLLLFTAGGCAWPDVPYLGVEHCKERVASLLDEVDEIRPDVIVLSEFDSGAIGAFSQAESEAGARRTVARFPAGTRLVVLGDVPTLSRDPIECLANHLLDIAPCDGLRIPVAPHLTETVRSMARGVGALYVDSSQWICPGTRCPLIQGNLLVFRDRSHITRPFASSLAPKIDAALTPVWATLPNQPGG